MSPLQNSGNILSTEIAGFERKVLQLLYHPQTGPFTHIELPPHRFVDYWLHYQCHVGVTDAVIFAQNELYNQRQSEGFAKSLQFIG